MPVTIEPALTILRHHGLKITKQRQALLNYLADHQDYYVDVSQVDDHMRQLFAGMSHNTIYRNIKEFEDLGLVEQQMIDKQARVKYQCDFQHQHHHHFICSNCGKVTELDNCPMDVFAAQLPGYQITGHRIELYGLCANCAAKLQAVKA